MEKAAPGQCSVIYYCPGCRHDISELYYAASPPPEVTPQAQQGLVHILNNVRRLIDVDQGNFEQVYVSSDPERCREKLDILSHTMPIAVLVEFDDGTGDEKHDNALNFMHSLLEDMRSARYSQLIMPVALLATSEGLEDELVSDSKLSTADIDTMRSPLCSEAINQLVGRVKEITKPSAQALGSNMAWGLVDSITNSTRPKPASHRPDEVLSAQRRSAVEDAIGKWQFPAHDFDMDELTYGAFKMLQHVLQNPELESYRLPQSELMTFLLAVRRQYRHEREVHYHNWRHAVDVTQSVYCFLCDVRLCPAIPSAPRKQIQVNAVERLLSPFDALILLVSAIGHDVGHPGVNNAFLVASNHQLAHMYNDKSVLENYHCAAYSQVLRRHWSALDGIPHFRSTMISTILATDMQRHFEYMGHLNELKQKVQRSNEELTDWTDKDKEHARELIMALLIKAADISNVARPFDIAAQWAKILMNEFARQGELESELQIPTCLFGGPPNREDLLAAAQSQKGFMNLFGFPLFRGIAEVLPNVSCTISELEHNKEVWEQRILDEKMRREAIGDGRKSPLTYGSVGETEVAEARERKRKSEPTAVPAVVAQAPSSPIQRQKGADLRHPASDQRQRLQFEVSPAGEQKRSSTPVLWPNAAQLAPAIGGSSRRSSKDVALNSLQELSTMAQQNMTSATSRRGSADAAWQIHQNYPGSRRGSKEESLTTILVTSQGSPASRSVPASPKIGGKPASASGPRQNGGDTLDTTRQSVPSPRPHTTSSATAAAERPFHSSTQLTSGVPVGTHHNQATEGASEDQLPQSDEWFPDQDDLHHSSAPAALPWTPRQQSVSPTVKSDSPHKIISMTSGESTASRSDRWDSDPSIPKSRSFSRLRGLKFWKKRRDADRPPTGSYMQSP